MRILINDFAGHPFQIQLSRALARCGHTVLHTYFGANNTPKGQTDAAGDELVIDNITIGREFNKHSLLSRRAADIDYGSAVCSRITAFRPDIVISANTPLDAQRMLLSVTHECGGRFVFWLQDLLSFGIEFVLRKKRFPLAGLVARQYRRLELRLLQNSDAVVCIAPEFCSVLERWQVDGEKTFIIENWAPLEEVYPLPRSNAWSREHDLDGKFCFMYSGTLGMKHKPELLLELARRFESHKDVVTVVIAEGAGADWLRENQHHVRPGALRLLPFQAYERLPEVLASSDVLITLLNEDCGRFAVPSKALAYLCAGRPLLVAAPADNLASRIVHRAEAGEAVSTLASEFVSAAARLLDDSEARERYAAQARDYAERNFNIANIQDDFMTVLSFALGNRVVGTAKAVPENAAVCSAD